MDAAGALPRPATCPANLREMGTASSPNGSPPITRDKTTSLAGAHIVQQPAGHGRERSASGEAVYQILATDPELASDLRNVGDSEQARAIEQCVRQTVAVLMLAMATIAGTVIFSLRG